MASSDPQKHGLCGHGTRATAQTGVALLQPGARVDSTSAWIPRFVCDFSPFVSLRAFLLNAALGPDDHNVPVTDAVFDAEAFARIEAIVAERHPRNVLVHCSTSNRAGGWLATHLASHNELEVDEALAVGRRAGITKPEIEQRVRAFLSASPAHP